VKTIGPNRPIVFFLSVNRLYLTLPPGFFVCFQQRPGADRELFQEISHATSEKTRFSSRHGGGTRGHLRGIHHESPSHDV
jgi:hypothetical protein